MSALAAVVKAGFTEARRNRVTVVVAVFAMVMILMTTVVLNTTVFTLDRAVTDFGLGVMNVLLVGLAVFLSVGMLSREIERRTVFLVVSRPLSRSSFVVGRVLGAWATLTVLLVVMGALYFLQVLLFEVKPTTAMGAALFGLWVELLLLVSLGIFFSAFSSQLVSGLCVIGLYFVGHLAPDLYRFAQNSPSRLISVGAGVLYRVLPNLDRFDYRVEAAHAATIDGGELAFTALYGACWAVGLTIAAAWAFSRRDFK